MQWPYVDQAAHPPFGMWACRQLANACLTFIVVVCFGFFALVRPLQVTVWQSMCAVHMWLRLQACCWLSGQPLLRCSVAITPGVVRFCRPSPDTHTDLHQSALRGGGRCHWHVHMHVRLNCESGRRPGSLSPQFLPGVQGPSHSHFFEVVAVVQVAHAASSYTPNTLSRAVPCAWFTC
jgi:hypothetical protein